MLKIINLSKSYKNKKAIENISIEVNKGEYLYKYIRHNIKNPFISMLS